MSCEKDEIDLINSRDLSVAINKVGLKDNPDAKSEEDLMSPTDSLVLKNYQITLSDANLQDHIVATEINLEQVQNISITDVIGDFQLLGENSNDESTISPVYYLNASFSGSAKDTEAKLEFINTNWAFLLVDGDGAEVESVDIDGVSIYPLENNDFYAYIQPGVYSTLNINTQNGQVSIDLGEYEVDDAFVYEVISGAKSVAIFKEQMNLLK